MLHSDKPACQGCASIEATRFPFRFDGKNFYIDSEGCCSFEDISFCPVCGVSLEVMAQASAESVRAYGKVIGQL